MRESHVPFHRRCRTGQIEGAMNNGRRRRQKSSRVVSKANLWSAVRKRLALTVCVFAL